MKRCHRVAAIVAALVFSTMCAASAAAKPNVKLVLSGAIVSLQAGKPVQTPMNRPVKSGEIIRYTVLAVNAGSASAFKLSPVGKVPSQTQFLRVDRSPKDAAVAYTLDGVSWSAHPTIVKKTRAGTTTVAPAPLDMYRAVRWTMLKPLAAHQSASFVYEVRVR